MTLYILFHNWNISQLMTLHPYQHNLHPQLATNGIFFTVPSIFNPGHFNVTSIIVRLVETHLEQID